MDERMDSFSDVAEHPDVASDAGTSIDVLDVLEYDERAGKDGKIKGSVSMSRSLINGSHGLTLNEKRLLMTALRGIDSKKSAWHHNHNGMAGQVTVRVTAEQFAGVADLGDREGREHSAAYQGLIDACERLATRRVRYKEGGDIVTLPWVTLARYRPGEAWAEVTFHPALNPHIFALRNRFVSYPLEYARGLQSVYSWRLLELLMKERDRGRLFIKLEDLCISLAIPETYKFGDIKRRVIQLAVDELNKKGDFVIGWQAKKTGRAVSSLDFTCVENPQRKLSLEA
jgi:plasmid replication initiation protein